MIKSISEAKAHFSAIVDEASGGKTFVICRAGRPLVTVSQYIKSKPTRRPDQLKGKIRIADDFDALLKRPGVGRKSANLIMGDVFGKPAIVTDTHCIRLTNRMGLVDGIKEPKKVEMALWKIIPPEEGSDFCHRLVFHGRDICTARTKPYCDRCCLQDICAKNGVE